jgi:hypothetical protein
MPVPEAVSPTRLWTIPNRIDLLPRNTRQTMSESTSLTPALSRTMMQILRIDTHPANMPPTQARFANP